MEKAAIAAAANSLQALVDATNLRPQQLQLKPAATLAPVQLGIGLGDAADLSVGWENSENAAPQASSSTGAAAAAAASAASGRKRPPDAALDEPDGPFETAAVHRALPSIQIPPMKKRQRASLQPQSLMQRQQQQRAQQQQQQQQQQPLVFSAADSASESVTGTTVSPINLVKRECNITLHCVVEFKQRSVLPQLQQQQQQHRNQQEQERSGFATVPSDLPVSDLTRFVLNRLGIAGINPADCSTKLAMPSWKPLALADICVDAESTSVGSLLQHVCTSASLRIELPLPDAPLIPSHIMRTLLQSLVPPQMPAGSQAGWLRQIGCPLDEVTMEAYLQSPSGYEFSATDRALFGDWHNRLCMQYLEQMSKAPPSLLTLPLPILPLPSVSQSYQPLPAVLELQQQQQGALQLSASSSPAASTSSGGQQRPGRLRTCFDAETEVPLLQQWFTQNPHPGRELLTHYRDVLNDLPIRRNGSRRPLDNANVAYWFKNMRATERRQSSSCLTTPAAAAAAGPSTATEATVGESRSESSSPQPDAPLRLCSTEESEAEPASSEAQLLFSSQNLPVGIDESIESGGGGGASKRRRTRVFIDPATEIPQLEIWFDQDSHPSSAQFQLYAQILNGMPFRQRQPHLEAKNVQLWFKNHRAKVKRERLPELPAGGDATAGANAAAAAASATTDDDLDVETTDADVEVDTIDAGDDATVGEAASPPAALELVCKAEHNDPQ